MGTLATDAPIVPDSACGVIESLPRRCERVIELVDGPIVADTRPSEHAS